MLGACKYSILHHCTTTERMPRIDAVVMLVHLFVLKRVCLFVCVAGFRETA